MDGAYYDVGTLEEHWSTGRRDWGDDFFRRVFGARAMGLDELDARLRTGQRPTVARLLDGDFVPLPPCDPSRAALVHVAAPQPPPSEPAPPSSPPSPRHEHRDSRALVGDGQPVAFPHDVERLHVLPRLACVLGDELSRAEPSEARRAICGYSLLLDWTRRRRPTVEPLDGTEAPAQLGPYIVAGGEARLLQDRSYRLEIGGECVFERTVAELTYRPEELLAWVSYHVALRPGDVVAIDVTPHGIAYPVDEGVTAVLSVDPVMTLSGRAVMGPEPGPWRL